MNRWCSRSCCTASTTRRLISRKSPTFSGKGTSPSIAHEAIERRGRGLLQPAVAVAQAALRIDHVVAVMPGGDQSRDHLRRILQVGVDDDHRIALRMVEPGGGGDLLAEIARQVDHGDVAVGLPQHLDDAERGVAAAVVDVDDLPRCAQRRHRRGEAAMHFADDLGLVVHRDDNREDRTSLGCISIGGRSAAN